MSVEIFLSFRAPQAPSHPLSLADSSSLQLLPVQIPPRPHFTVYLSASHILTYPPRDFLLLSRDFISLLSQNLKKMLGTVGNLQKAELVDDGEDSKWKRGIVTYDLKEDAQTAIERFHETPFEVSL